MRYKMKVLDRIMKLSSIAISVMVFAAALEPVKALDINEIGEKMKLTACYKDSVTYEVLLPSLADPVTYTIGLESAPAKGDTLAPCKYVITWSLPAPSGLAKGFSAYFDGSHFRFRDKRLQEYHYAENPDSFSPLGRTDRGVQRQVQFADLLPQFIGEQFGRMAADSSYIVNLVPDTLVDGLRSVVVTGVRRVSGVDASEFLYVLDADSYMPRRIEFENNPGQISEQSIVIKYKRPAGKARCKITLESLMASQPEAFGKYRENTFSLETLPGRPLPRIVAPTATGERYMHEREESFSVPTVFVFLDATVGSTPDVIKAVRQGVDTLPFQTDVVWAFLNHRAEDVDGFTGENRPGEHLLINAGGAARDCGVGYTTPAMIFTATDGHVTDVQVGYNQDLPSIVIQKITNSKYNK